VIPKMNIVPSVRITIALALAAVALLIYGGRSIDPDKFGLDPTVVLSQEEWKGVPFTGSTINAIITVAERQRQAKLSVEPPCKPTTILWRGNSQLHFINQFQRGEHVAPFWLRKSVDCPDAFVPLVVSLPNASLQEHYVLAEYFWRRFPIRTVILQLCFDDLREDGLRGAGWKKPSGLVQGWGAVQGVGDSQLNRPNFWDAPTDCQTPIAAVIWCVLWRFNGGSTSGGLLR
jgi:hypothetical protein